MGSPCALQHGPLDPRIPCHRREHRGLVRGHEAGAWQSGAGPGRSASGRFSGRDVTDQPLHTPLCLLTKCPQHGLPKRFAQKSRLTLDLSDECDPHAVCTPVWASQDGSGKAHVGHVRPVWILPTFVYTFGRREKKIV